MRPEGLYCAEFTPLQPPPPPQKKREGESGTVKLSHVSEGGEGREDKSSSRSSVRLVSCDCLVVKYCTVLHCTVLHCTVHHCTVLYFTVLYFTVLDCTSLYCTSLYYTVLHCTGLGCVGRGDSPSSVTLVAAIVLLSASRLPRALCVCVI